jgi:tetratricopeptide (TPR) repeat protein
MFNIARAHFDKKQYAQTMEYLQKALELNPDQTEARKFAEFLIAKGLAKANLPESSPPLGVSPTDDAAAARAAGVTMDTEPLTDDAG